MIRRWLIAALLAGSVWCLAAMIWPALGPWGPWGFAAATLAVPSILLGLARSRQRTGIRGLGPAAALFVVLQVSGWTLILAAPPRTALAGLPLGAWVLLLGFGVLPLPLLATWFALDPENRG